MTYLSLSPSLPLTEARLALHNDNVRDPPEAHLKRVTQSLLLASHTRTVASLEALITCIPHEHDPVVVQSIPLDVTGRRGGAEKQQMGGKERQADGVQTTDK
jgi:hypothetical protein